MAFPREQEGSSTALDTKLELGADATRAAMIEPLSKRVNSLGWHVDINMSPDQIAANEDLWTRLPSMIVFDHLAHMLPPAGVNHPGS